MSHLVCVIYRPECIAFTKTSITSIASVQDVFKHNLLSTIFMAE